MPKTRKSGKYCVWVIEIAVLHATRDAIAKWEIWQPFNTRAEAIQYRRENTGTFAERGVPKEYWRIRKYIPEVSA